MIDLHCHMLPGLDDGAKDMAMSLAMARISRDDGVQIVACTPHIYTGLYSNDGSIIQQALAEFQQQLQVADIDLEVTSGADIHLDLDLETGLRHGRILSLNGSRYFLLEPPHHVIPPDLRSIVRRLLVAGFVPVITHPERLTWVQDHYDLFLQLVQDGAWLQLTAGSLVGRFGTTAQYWGERFLDDGLVHVLASDGHGVDHRPPILSEGYQVAIHWLGAEEAYHLVHTRPRGILDDHEPTMLPVALGVRDSSRRGYRHSIWRRWFQ